ncbi:MAG: flagellar biosynthetic protein FliO [Nitrospirae bacterium]|nr:flagellar biosynthetic protein FliO [Nitrospirota bacterium]
MKRIILLLILLVMPAGWVEYSIAESPALVLLKNVEVTSTAEVKKVELKFDGVPNEFVPSYREEFVQVELNNTSVIPPKQWINVKDGFFKNIFVYQFDDKTVRARFYTNGNAINLQDKIKFTNENDSIVVTYNVSGVQSAVPVAQNVQGDATAEHSESSADNNSENRVLAGGVKEDAAARHLTPIPSAAPEIFGSFVKMIVVLGILIALLLVVLYVVKKYLWKKIGKGGKEDGIKVITSAYVGPKKSIALVEVAGERIVVGITPDNISMLTKVSKDMEFHEVLNEQVSTVTDDNVHGAPSPGPSPLGGEGAMFSLPPLQGEGRGGDGVALNNTTDKKVEINDELWEKA